MTIGATGFWSFVDNAAPFVWAVFVGLHAAQGDLVLSIIGAFFCGAGMRHWFPSPHETN